MLVSIRDAQGNEVYSLKKLAIYQLNDGYISEPLSLQKGNYKLTLFAMVDENDNIAYATPMEGSPMAEYVSDPLPIDFSVVEQETTTINPEVILIEEGMNIGYAAFGVEKVKLFNINVNVYFKTENQLAPAKTKLIMKAKKAGVVHWTKEFVLSASSNMITLKEGFDQYEFIINEPGYYPISEINTLSALKDNANQVFYLVPLASQLQSMNGLSYCCPGLGFVPFEYKFAYGKYGKISTIEGYYTDTNDQWIKSSTLQYSYFNSLGFTPTKVGYYGSTKFVNQVYDDRVLGIETFNNVSSVGNNIISIQYIEGTDLIEIATTYDKNTGSITTSYFQYDNKGDLIYFDAYLGDHLLYTGDLSYDSHDNVYPTHFLPSLLEGWTNNDLMIVPFYVKKPKHNIVSYKLTQYDNDAVHTTQLLTMNYLYDKNGKPASLMVTNVVKSLSQVINLTPMKDVTFEYN